MVFKVKVVDALKPGAPAAYLTLFEQNEEVHQSLRPGDRVRFMNVTPANVAEGPSLQLNVVKTSKIIHLSDGVLRKQSEVLERYRALAEHSCTLADFKRRYLEFATPSSVDVGFHCYLLKVISSKNAVTQEQEVSKVVVLTQDQEVVCIELWDRQFVWQRAFPKERTYVQFDNLSYIHSVLVKKRDTFEVFPNPSLAE